MDAPALKHQRDRFLKTLLATAPRDLYRWRAQEAVDEDLAAILDEHLALRTDLEWASEYRRAIGVGEVEEYCNRVIRCGSVELLCGIRFYGGDASKPFVDVISWTGDLPAWNDAVECVLNSFDRFSPRAIRVFTGSEAASDVLADQVVVPDQVLAAGSVRMLAEGPNAVMLRDADPEEAHAFLLAAYARLAKHRPRLADRVHASSLEELRDCSREGRLAWWLVDGEVAGLIAASRATLFGLSGYLMMDEAVAESHTGKGTAAQAQRALAASVNETDPDAVLFGTIDAINHASRRAAQRAGRKEIAGWWFIQPATSVPVSDVLALWE